MEGAPGLEVVGFAKDGLGHTRVARGLDDMRLGERGRGGGIVVFEVDLLLVVNGGIDVKRGGRHCD